MSVYTTCNGDFWKELTFVMS